MPNNNPFGDVMTDPWGISYTTTTVPLEPSSDEELACYSCGRNDSETWYTTSRGKLCDDCGRICDGCDNPFNIESGSPHAYIDDEIFCYRCTRADFFMCYHCDSWDQTDNSRETIQGTTICSNCCDSDFYYCEYCENYIPDHWSHDDCGTEGLVHDYSYKPVPVFHHTQDEWDNAKIIFEDANSVMRRYKQIAYLGFELEVECSGDRNDFRNGVNMLKDMEDIWYLKSDSSLNYGFELVSHPMTLTWAMDNLDFNLLANLKSHKFNAWHTDTAGLHVHVSRDGFESESHQARFVHFIMRNEQFLSWLAGRSSSRWASFNREHTHNLKHKLRNRGASDRYFAVNLQNSGTLEIRIFRSSYKPERIQMALQLVDAIVKYTQKLSVSEMVNGKGFTAGSFITWVSEDSRYAVLSDYITRWIEPFESGSQQIGE